jgi:hypothetical protein
VGRVVVPAPPSQLVTKARTHRQPRRDGQLLGCKGSFRSRSPVLCASLINRTVSPCGPFFFFLKWIDIRTPFRPLSTFMESENVGEHPTKDSQFRWAHLLSRQQSPRRTKDNRTTTTTATPCWPAERRSGSTLQDRPQVHARTAPHGGGSGGQHRGVPSSSFSLWRSQPSCRSRNGAAASADSIISLPSSCGALRFVRGVMIAVRRRFQPGQSVEGVPGTTGAAELSRNAAVGRDGTGRDAGCGCECWSSSERRGRLRRHPSRHRGTMTRRATTTGKAGGIGQAEVGCRMLQT